MGLAFFLAAIGGIELTRANGRIASVWIANAIAVGVLVGRARREWPALLFAAAAANVAANLVIGDSLLRALGFVLSNSLEVSLAAFLLAVRSPRPLTFDKAPATLWFLLVAAILAPASSAVLATALLAGGDQYRFFVDWYVADALGLMLFVPIVASLLTVRHGDQRSAGEVMLLAIAGVALGYVVFNQSAPVLFMIAPLLMFATFRVGIAGALVVLMAVGAVAMTATAKGMGPIARNLADPTARNYVLQLFAAAMLFMILPVRALIGERDRLSRRMAQSERMFARIAEASPAGIVYLGADGAATLANARWKELTGADALGEASMGWAAAFDPGEPSAVGALWERARSSLQPTEGEFRLARPGDGSRWGQLNIYPEVDAGEALGFVARLTDVTLRRKADDELVEARDAAEAAATAKGNFVAQMSHEIRTPLTGVIGMIDLLRVDPDPDEQQKYLATLKQSADLLLAVLDDVLDFSKLESDAMPIDAIDFDLEALIDNSLALFANAASRKGLLLEFDRGAAKATSAVRGDSVRLQQVLVNFLSNAIKFTDRGTIKVRLFADAPAPGQAARYRVEVEDSGIGFDDGDADQLFNPFVQAEASIARRFGGTGLGLSIARGIIAAMGGRIGATSRPGHGSTFWFEVPLLPASAPIAPVGERAPAAVATDRPLDVLVAEDNPVNQMLLRAYLSRRGHRVDTVRNGRLAVEAATARAFDVIVMDMQMPEMDGLAATRAIRGGGGPNAATPIVALTADASPERKRFYEGAGLSAFLTKPIDEPLLVETLGRLAASRDEGVSASAAAASSDALALDEARLAALSDRLGADRVDELLALLALDCRQRPAAVQLLLEAGDRPALAAAAHSAKGAADSIGATLLAQAARDLEDIAPGQSIEAAVRTFERCAAATARAIDAREAARLRDIA
ncbi:ATP-binding protein [Sphingomonas sp. ASV193]|uniref:ATP-binding protein n=1 Tax=Sphingomonas sp. ASV193 TaxID=3144405 RepID=UPI0032E8FD15